MFGIVSDDDFQDQLNKLNKNEPISSTDQSNKLAEIKEIKRGRPIGKKEISESTREEIAEASLRGAPAKQIAQLFDISPSSISAYKNGATSTATYDKEDKALVDSNKAVRDDIIVQSRSKLMMALESITPDKLADSKARDAAGIAKDMSAVIRNMEPERANGSNLNQQFIFYAPKTKTEKDFEIIEVE